MWCKCSLILCVGEYTRPPPAVCVFTGCEGDVCILLPCTAQNHDPIISSLLPCPQLHSIFSPTSRPTYCLLETTCYTFHYTLSPPFTWHHHSLRHMECFVNVNKSLQLPPLCLYFKENLRKDRYTTSTRLRHKRRRH